MKKLGNVLLWVLIFVYKAIFNIVKFVCILFISVCQDMRPTSMAEQMMLKWMLIVPVKLAFMIAWFILKLPFKLLSYLRHRPARLKKLPAGLGPQQSLFDNIND